MKITSAKTQLYALNNLNNTRVRVNIAKTTEDLSVMKEIINDGATRELVALASNPNLTGEIERELVDLSKENARIAKALFNRNEKE